jgi:hypothetical protein
MRKRLRLGSARHPVSPNVVYSLPQSPRDEARSAWSSVRAATRRVTETPHGGAQSGNSSIQADFIRYCSSIRGHPSADRAMGGRRKIHQQACSDCPDRSRVSTQQCGELEANRPRSPPQILQAYQFGHLRRWRLCSTTSVRLHFPLLRGCHRAD